MHRHKCEECDTVWEHDVTCFNNAEAHACPKCGLQQWAPYHGDLPATFFGPRTHSKTDPPAWLTEGDHFQ